MQVILDGINFPEGPCFDGNSDIWLVEKDAGNLIRINTAGSERFSVGGAPNGIAIDRDNVIWFCDSKQNSIRTFNPVSQNTETIVGSLGGKPLKMPNDLTFDKSQNLLFTCPGDTLNDNTGYFCCLTPNRKLIKLYGGMYYPNGLAFNQQQTHLYVAETGTHQIWRFDWDETELLVSNRTLFAETGGPIGPDGIAFDDDENLYVAVYGSGEVKVWNKDGKQLQSFNCGGKNPTNCAIDPAGIKGLIITEAGKGTLIQYPLTKRGII